MRKWEYERVNGGEFGDKGGAIRVFWRCPEAINVPMAMYNAVTMGMRIFFFKMGNFPDRHVLRSTL